MGFNWDFFLFGGKNFPFGNKKKKGCDLYKLFFEKKKPQKSPCFVEKQVKIAIFSPNFFSCHFFFPPIYVAKFG